MKIVHDVNGLRDISRIDIPWENPEVVWEVPNSPYSIVKCDTQWDYGMETYFLAHCLGTKEHESFSKAHVCFSLRDTQGIPHATILCVRENEYSPYGAGWDIGSVWPFEPGDESLRILQVRGRNDDIAMPLFHAMVRDWYTSKGGRIDVEITALVAYLKRNGDDDYRYHFGYLLDEEANHFQWAHHNGEARLEAWLAGTSL